MIHGFVLFCSTLLKVSASSSIRGSLSLVALPARRPRRAHCLEEEALCPCFWCWFLLAASVDLSSPFPGICESRGYWSCSVSLRVSLLPIAALPVVRVGIFGGANGREGREADESFFQKAMLFSSVASLDVGLAGGYLLRIGFIDGKEGNWADSKNPLVDTSTSTGELLSGSSSFFGLFRVLISQRGC